jgi:precorrin-2/cobalt-factor-2 C20-methyltransferase
MSLGTFYGIGIGPGDPELVTVKAAALLQGARHVFVPKARAAADSLALDIARRYVRADARVSELVFPMTEDRAELARTWAEAADAIAAVLEAGENACFLTLGDPLVYSTYIYLLRALRARVPEARAVTVPGVTAFCAGAALANFPLGEGKQLLTVVPTADDLTPVREAMARGGTVVLMKVGRRLPEILALLETAGRMEEAVFVGRAGLEGQRVEVDLRALKVEEPEAGYLSVILLHAGGRSRPCT